MSGDSSQRNLSYMYTCHTKFMLKVIYYKKSYLMYNWSLGVNVQSPINNACTGYSVILIQIMKPSKSLNYFLWRVFDY